MTIKLIGTTGDDSAGTQAKITDLDWRVQVLHRSIVEWQEVTTHMNEQLLGINKRLFALENVPPTPEPPAT